MGFGDRLEQTTRAIEILDEYLWNQPPFHGRILVVPFGYETRITGNVRQKMISMRNTTAKYIRFTPDFFVIDQGEHVQNQEELVYLLDYKTTQTPIYLESRVMQIARDAGVPDLKAEDIGQMETDAYNNYMELHDKMKAQVVILNYCAYHPRLLLCDYIEKIQLLRQDKVIRPTTTGSRTPYTNFDCRSMRSLYQFLAQEHHITMDKDVYRTLCRRLQSELPIKHHEKSPYYSSNQ